MIEVFKHRSGVIRAAMYKRPLWIDDSRTSKWDVQRELLVGNYDGHRKADSGWDRS